MDKIKLYGIRNIDEINDEYQIKNNTFGNNVGNSLFRMAVYRTVDWSKCEIVKSIEDTDVFCLLLANSFARYFKEGLQNFTKKIVDYNKKTVVIGVGIQNTKEFADETLVSALREFVKAIISRDGSIGVRGSITYNLVCDIMGSSQGIYNIGCPSMRYFGNELPMQKKRKIFSDQLKIAVNFTPYGDTDELTSFYDNIWRSFPNSFAIMQDQCEALLLLEDRDIPDYRVREMLPSYKQHFMIRQNRCRIHPNTRKWIETMSTFDFCIGSRIHGCVAAILAGVPTLLIAIDERQVEIAQFNRIPYIRQDMVSRNTSMSALYEFACENMGEIYENYDKNLKIYTDFLQLNGIPVNDLYKNNNDEGGTL
ncbi:MAG: polysaccharide pyruvyl transferase family protein [Lachnospiraceae bacterium]|nr:polysaccharide pyruvyl transferase family protein [Lachnospiraceae bacterium]